MTKITVYPPDPVAPNSPIQSVTVAEGDEVDWIYMSVGTVDSTMNYIYGYTIIKPVNLFEAGEQIKRMAVG